MKDPFYRIGVFKYSIITVLLLLLHSLRDAVKDLRHHSSKLIQHTLPKIIEGSQHLLQPHPLQEDRVSAGTVGIFSHLLYRGVQIIQECLPEDFAEFCTQSGGQRVTAGCQSADLIDQAVERFLDANNLDVCVVKVLIDQNVPSVSTTLTVAKAAGDSAEKVLNLKTKTTEQVTCRPLMGSF